MEIILTICDSKSHAGASATELITGLRLLLSQWIPDLAQYRVSTMSSRSDTVLPLQNFEMNALTK